MGTSGSYGGSGSKPWDKTRATFEAAIAGAGAGAPTAAPSAGGPAGVPPSAVPPVAGGPTAGAFPDPLAPIAGAIADALWHDDPRVRRPAISPIGSLLPRARVGGRGVGGGGGGGGGGARTIAHSGGSGREGTRSRRQISRGVQRGAAAIAAGYAVRSGDRAALESLRLDLDQLRGMTVFKQCDRILAALIGEGAHPDDAVFRKAAAEQVKAVLSADTPPDPLRVIQDYVARVVVDLGILEIRAQMKAGLPDAEVVEKERDLKDYVRARVRNLGHRLAGDGVVSVRNLQETAARVTREALAVLRAGAPAT